MWYLHAFACVAVCRLASVLEKSSGTQYSNPLLGDALVVIAQVHQGLLPLPPVLVLFGAGHIKLPCILHALH